MKVAGYIRVSTQEQSQGNGLDYQQFAIEEYAKANNLTLGQIYSDIESGTKKIRKGLSQLLQELEQYDAILVYHTDRLSRKLAHLLILIDQIGKAGKRIVSTSQPEFDLNNPTGRLVFSILGAVSEFELTRITERMVNGREMVKRKAAVNGNNLNYGKRPQFGEHKRWLIQPDGSVLKVLEPDTKELETIALIKRHRRSGKSYYAIARYLNAQNHPNKTGKPWNEVTVKALCKRRSA